MVFLQHKKYNNVVAHILLQQFDFLFLIQLTDTFLCKYFLPFAMYWLLYF